MATGFCCGRYWRLLRSISDETRFCCGSIERGSNWLFSADIGRIKMLPNLSEKANWAVVSEGRQAVASRPNWLFQIGPGVASLWELCFVCFCTFCGVV
jgi:hypothetical protein